MKASSQLITTLVRIADLCLCWARDLSRSSPTNRAVRIAIVAGPVTEIGEGHKEDTMTIAMTNTQKVTLTIRPLNSRGGAAQLDGIPEWSTSDSSILSLEPSADGKTCLVKAAGGEGIASVVVSGDADLGAGVVGITGTTDFDVTGGQATTIEIEADQPTEIE